MRHFASPTFWASYRRLPEAVRKLADKNFELLKANPNHPSLQFKKIGGYRTVRVGIHYRAVAVAVEGGALWFWIGSHSDYNKVLG